MYMKSKSNTEKRLFPMITLDRRNLIIFFVGLFVLAVGFIMLSIGPWDNPLSRSVAPMILLLGYLILFPAAIFFGGSIRGEKEPEDNLSRSKSGLKKY